MIKLSAKDRSSNGINTQEKNKIFLKKVLTNPKACDIISKVAAKAEAGNDL